MVENFQVERKRNMVLAISSKPEAKKESTDKKLLKFKKVNF